MAKMTSARLPRRRCRWRAAIMVLGLFLSVVSQAAMADEEEQGSLCLVDLPEEARVEIDGAPVEMEGDCLLLAAGTYLLTVFPRSAPPFEAFVDIEAGDEVVVGYEPPTKLSAEALPPPTEVADPVVGPALVGASFVMGMTSLASWVLASRTGSAAATVSGRDDLDANERQRMLDDLDRRQAFRRDLAGASGAAAAALLVAGGALWTVSAAGDDSPVALGPSLGGMTLTVSLR